MTFLKSAPVRVAVAAAMSCPFAALAQTEAPPPSSAAPPPIVGLEEITVTAQKRQQSLQDVPLSVSAFTGDMLKQGRMADIRGIVDFTPGFSGKTEDGFTDALAMRGISTNDFGIGGDPSVAMFVDGVWSGRTGGVMTAMYDVERAEVVKGPQGTLFGRNSIAGAVSVITNKPDHAFGGSAELTLADFDHVEAEAMLNLPLGEQWALRASGYLLDNGGFLENLQGGDDLGFHRIAAGRVSLRRESEALDAVLTLAYEDREQDPSVYWVPAAGLDDEVVDIDLGDDGVDESDVFEGRLSLVWTLPSGHSLTSLTGYKKFAFAYLEDYDGGPNYVNNYGQYNDVEYWSQEFRLNSPNEGKVTWFAGVSAYGEKIEGLFDYLYDEDDLCRQISITEAPDFDGPAAGCDDPNFEAYWEDDIDPADILHDKTERSYVNVDSRGWAAYGDFTWAVSDRFELTAGARYTYDKKEMESRILDSGGALGNNFNFEFFTNGFVRNSSDWSDFTPRIAASFDVSDEVTLYATASRGYKSGGFATFGYDLHGQEINDDGSAPDGTTPLEFDPEQVDSYEIGVKSRLLGNTMRLNASLFRYDYTDLQLVYFDQGSSLVANVGEATGQGLELDLRWLPSERWDATVGLSLLDTEITDADEIIEIGACGDCDGKSLPFAPEVSASAILSYKWPMSSGEGFFTTEYVYRSKMYGGPDNLPDATVDAWDEFAFRIGYRTDDSWYVTLWIENAFDEVYFERGWENADANNEFGYGLFNELVWPSRPRTLGVTFGTEWK
ncbi:MAG TPA: TonB-dependent receptor [Steroidobacteraceae bacterium]|nr:TonB-dependent receptor [Steroidobacteraceae bacterium]